MPIQMQILLQTQNANVGADAHDTSHPVVVVDDDDDDDVMLSMPMLIRLLWLLLK